MSWSDQVVKAGAQKPLSPRLVVYGPPGVGKSTFGSTLPNPIFIDLDKGIDDIRVDRIRETPKTWPDMLGLVRAIAKDTSGYQSLVIDTVDPLEEMTMDYVAQQASKSFQKMNDDYGSGYVAVGAEWKLLLAELDACRQAGMLVCMLAHAVVRTALDPQLGSFDQFTTSLGKKAWSQTARWADVVGFTTFDAAVAKTKDDERVIVTGDRLLFTTRGTGYEAKNRYGILGKLPLSWKALETSITKHRGEVNVLKARIAALAATMPADVQTKARNYVEKAQDDVFQLRATVAGLELKAEELKQNAPPQAPFTPETVEQKAATTGAPIGEILKAAGIEPERAAEIGRGLLDKPPTEPSRGSAEAIELRILKLAEGTPMFARAQELVTKAAKDLRTLLLIEENLTKKLNSNSQSTTGA